MFNIGITITPNKDPSEITLLDNSTGDETVISRSALITKVDLTQTTYPFPSGINTININGFIKDYAISLDYTVVTNVTSYTKKTKFVLLGYSRQYKTNRIKFYEINNNLITDKDQFRKNSLDINYYMMVANDRVAFSDIIGAQKALDYIKDIVFKEELPITEYGCTRYTE